MPPGAPQATLALLALLGFKRFVGFWQHYQNAMPQQSAVVVTQWLLRQEAMPGLRAQPCGLTGSPPLAPATFQPAGRF